jgi:hypothetical protein
VREREKSVPEKENSASSQETEKIPEVSLRKRFLNPRTFISFTLAIAFLIFLLVRLDVDLSITWQKVRSSHPLFYLFALLSHYIAFPVRGLRWRLILNNVGFRKEEGVALPSTWGLSQMVVLNWFANSVLSARLGDAYRAYLLKEDIQVSFSKTLGTIAAERVMDFATTFLLMLFAGLLLWRSSGTAFLLTLLEVGLAVVLLLSLLLVLMWRFGGNLGRRIPSRVQSIWRLFREGTLGSFRQLRVIALLSLGVWLLETGRLFFVAQSLDIALPLTVVLFTALGHALITALPVTPGGLGLAETGVAGLLVLLVATLAKEDAWSVALVDRSISYLSIVFFGLLLFLYRASRQKRASPN